MDEEKDFLEEFKKIKIVQKCPKCGHLSMKYSDGKLVCENCSFAQNIGKL